MALRLRALAGLAGISMACGGSQAPVTATDSPKQATTASTEPAQAPTALDCTASVWTKNRTVTVGTKHSRNNAKSLRFSEHASSERAPIEVCSVRKQLELLTRMRCDDGSNPFRDLNQAHEARIRNTGATGRCGGVVDVYRASCPAQDYELYLDSYVCLASELDKDAAPHTLLTVEGADIPIPLSWIYYASSTKPFRATLVSQERTKMVAIATLAIVDWAGASALVREAYTEWDVSLPVKVPTAAERIIRQPFGDGLESTVYWQEDGDLGKLIIIIAPAKNDYIDKQFVKNLDQFAEALQPNSHQLVDDFRVQSEQGLAAICANGAPKGGLRLRAEQRAGQRWLTPKGWSQSTSSNMQTSIQQSEAGQVRFVEWRQDQNMDALTTVRSHMRAIQHGRLIANSPLDKDGLHTIHDTRGARVFMSSVEVQNGQRHYFMTGPIEQLKKSEYGAMFSTIVSGGCPALKPAATKPKP